MAKRKKKSTPEEWAEREARRAETDRLLLERIAYHRAKSAEERAKRPTS
jgi:hypothetical protein